nr:SIMPL domain-containing protein [Sphingomonas jinjuensis]
MSAFIGVAAAIAVPSAVAAQQTAPTTVEPLIPAASTVLDISAEGKATRPADLATIRAGVVSQGTSAGAALSDNAARMARVLAALKRAGIAPRDIATADVSLSPQYRYTDGQPPAITGYQATNSVAVKFRDVAKAGPILDALVAQGANQIDGPSLSVAEPDAALDEARGDALKRARARADLYARAAGLRVARIVSINETGQDAGGPNPPVLYARAMAADARTAIQPGEKDITVTLAVRFLLQ